MCVVCVCEGIVQYMYYTLTTHTVYVVAICARFAREAPPPIRRPIHGLEPATLYTT